MQVLRYCFYLWLCLGNSKFERLRDVLVLPSRRRLQLFKSSIPSGDGYRKDVFEKLGELWEGEVKSDSDRDVILSWDATGYSKAMSFNKHTGVLEGFSYDPESFSMHQMFANKVNCFMVSSPEQRIKIKFPVAYYHCTTLDSAAIRRQWYEVMVGLNNIGLRVVAIVCDGASEHSKFFNRILEEISTHDPSILVRIGNTWVVSDPPHLIKKFRNNWLSSGELDRHTRRLLIDGHHIGWSVVPAAHTTSTTTSDGRPRPLVSVRKLKYPVTEPTGIQRLRVGLAAIPFSQDVQDFVQSNLSRVAREARVTEGDVKATLKFCSNVNELFKIMNSKRPITWTEENDLDGVVIGLRDKLDTTHGFTLNFFSKEYGVSVKTLMEVSGLPSGDSVPAHGSVLVIDRLKRLKEIADYFKSWKEQIDGLQGFTKQQKSRMFITHWLYTDLRRTCYSIVELMTHYVTRSSRRWVLRRFTQDPIESLFGQMRNLAGSNTNLHKVSVDLGMSEIRSTGLKDLRSTM